METRDLLVVHLDRFAILSCKVALLVADSKTAHVGHIEVSLRVGRVMVHNHQRSSYWVILELWRI